MKKTPIFFEEYELVNKIQQKEQGIIYLCSFQFKWIDRTMPSDLCQGLKRI